MKQNRSFQWKGSKGNGKTGLMPVFTIPLIVIILIVVIVVTDWKKKPEEAGTTLPPQTVDMLLEAETMVNEADKEGSAEYTELKTEAPETNTLDEFETEGLRRDSVPEILDLMKRYFAARASADVEMMNCIYGGCVMSAETLEEQKSLMRNNAKYVRDFENVTTYVQQGLEADHWLVYALADVRFHSVNTTAPIILTGYVRRDADGNYLLMKMEELSENVRQFIEVSKHSEEVRRLASSVNVKLKIALNEDEDLKAVYGVLRDGSPVYSDRESGAEVVILEDEGAGETEESGQDTGSEAESGVQNNNGDGV